MKRITLIILAILMIALTATASATLDDPTSLDACFNGLSFDNARESFIAPYFEELLWQDMPAARLDDLRAMSAVDVYQQPMHIVDYREVYVIGNVRTSQGEKVVIHVYDAPQWPGSENHPHAWLIVPLGRTARDGYQHPPAGCSVWAAEPSAFLDAVTD